MDILPRPNSSFFTFCAVHYFKVDGDFIAVALEGSVKIKEQIPRLLNEHCEMYVTKCVVADLEQRAQQDVFWKGALLIAKTMNYMKCCHSDLAKPTDCIRLICSQQISQEKTKEGDSALAEDEKTDRLETTNEDDQMQEDERASESLGERTTKFGNEAENEELGGQKEKGRKRKGKSSHEKKMEQMAILKKKKHLILGVQHTEFRSYVRKTFPYIPALWFRGRVPVLDLPSAAAKELEEKVSKKKSEIDESTRRLILQSKLALMDPKKRERYLARKNALKKDPKEKKLEKLKRKLEKRKEKAAGEKGDAKLLKGYKESSGEEQNVNGQERKTGDLPLAESIAKLEEKKRQSDSSDSDDDHESESMIVTEGKKRRLRNRKRRSKQSNNNDDTASSDASLSPELGSGIGSKRPTSNSTLANESLADKLEGNPDKRVKTEGVDARKNGKDDRISGKRPNMVKDGIRVGNSIWRGVVETTAPGSNIRTFKLEKGFQPQEIDRKVRRKNYTENSKVKEEGKRAKAREQFVDKSRKPKSAQ